MRVSRVGAKQHERQNQNRTESFEEEVLVHFRHPFLVTEDRLMNWLICRRFEKDKTARNSFFTKWLPHTHARGGQVEPVLGRIWTIGNVLFNYSYRY
jgi:hypothetical protein